MRASKPAALAVVSNDAPDLAGVMLDSADDLLQCCKALDALTALLADRHGGSELPAESLCCLLDCVGRRMNGIQQHLQQTLG